MNFFSDALSYPFRGSGKYILLIGSVISILSKMAAWVPLLGTIAGILFFGYFCSIYFQIIQSSAVGEDEAPQFPDFSNLWDDLLWPMLQTWMVLLLSFGPVMGYVVFGGDNIDPWVSLTLLALGTLYAPMALLGIAILGYFGAVSPHIVVPSIFRGGWPYLSGVGLLVILYGSQLLINHMMGGGVIAALMMSVTGMYCLMANSRAMGLTYRKRVEELNWL